MKLVSSKGLKIEIPKQKDNCPKTGLEQYSESLKMNSEVLLNINN